MQEFNFCALMGVKLDDRVINIKINRGGHTRRIERRFGSITLIILVYGGGGRYVNSQYSILHASPKVKALDIGILHFHFVCFVIVAWRIW